MYVTVTGIEILNSQAKISSLGCHVQFICHCLWSLVDLHYFHISVLVIVANSIQIWRRSVLHNNQVLIISPWVILRYIIHECLWRPSTTHCIYVSALQCSRNAIEISKYYTLISCELAHYNELMYWFWVIDILHLNKLPLLQKSYNLA